MNDTMTQEAGLGAGGDGWGGWIMDLLVAWTLVRYLPELSCVCILY